MNRRMFAPALAPSVALALAFSMLAFTGCRTEAPRSPVAGLTKPLSPPESPDLGREPATATGSGDGAYSMYVTESVRTACSGPDPFFSFDSSRPMTDDTPTMKNLVTCMTSGPLRGKTIKLVGHTDPRGTAEYNDKLGLERAEKVKKYLVTNGIDQARVQTASIGADEASSAPKDWGRERRVEIQLVR